MKNYLKKNKGLFLLPLGLIPFLILIFYVLGGGKGQKQEVQQKNQTTTGANYILPEAEKSIEIFDKLEAYQSQGIESEGLVNDVWKADSIGRINKYPGDSTASEITALAEQNKGLPENLLAHIKQKEREVKMEMEGPKPDKNVKPVVQKQREISSVKSASINPKTGEREKTPFNGIEELEKVFDENIQLNRQNDSLKFYLEQTQRRLAEIEQIQHEGFSLEKTNVSGFNKNEENSNLIKAEIYETTTVFDGNRVKLRLLEDTRINGEEVPKNIFIYGICKVKNERLHIEISQMPVRGNFLAVRLAIHDLDGLPGLYVPENVARKVTQEVGAGTNTSSMLGVTNSPLTYAGIRAVDRTAQTFFKRVRLKKVTLKKNTLVYIINQQPMAGL